MADWGDFKRGRPFSPPGASKTQRILAMPYIVWSERNELGIRVIDEQHHGIVITINTLHRFIQEGQGSSGIGPTLNALRQYTKTHFLTEENLFRRAGYPDHKAHMALHRTLMDRTIEIAEHPDTLDQPELVLKFLKDWWLNHIGGEDVKYAPYVKRMMGLG